MNKVLYCAAAAVAFATLTAVSAAETIKGAWSIVPSATAGDVHLQVSMYSGDDDHSSDSSSVNAASLGLSQQELNAGGHHVTFTVARDAGSFLCDGWLDSGRGGGSLTFTPSAAYHSQMLSLGYDLTPEQQASAAMLDVTVTYVESLASAGLPHVEFNQLFALRALGVDDVYLRQMRDAGTLISDAREAIQLRALKVNPDYVRALAAVGYDHLSTRELVQMRALKIDADYVKRVQAHGFKHPSIEELVRMKAMNLI